MKIQVVSDLHLEHGGSLPAHHLEADVIALAGDLAPYNQGLVERVRERWSSAPHVVYVLGNHEFYGTGIDETRARLAEVCASAGIHLLDPGMVRIEDTRFIGTMLWTDFTLEKKADKVGTHLLASRGISDFRSAIRHRGRRFATRRTGATTNSNGRTTPANGPSSSPTTPRAHARSDRGSRVIRSIPPSHRTSTGYGSRPLSWILLRSLLGAGLGVVPLGLIPGKRVGTDTWTRVAAAAVSQTDSMASFVVGARSFRSGWLYRLFGEPCKILPIRSTARLCASGGWVAFRDGAVNRRACRSTHRSARRAARVRRCSVACIFSTSGPG